MRHRRLALLLLSFAASAKTQLVIPVRPASTSWKRTLCGTLSSVQPPIPEGKLEIGRDYPGNDVAPCGIHGCVMAAGATMMDCKGKCAQASLCTGYVFADANCSGRAGPVCYTKSSMLNGVAGKCRDSQAIGYAGSNGTEIPTKWAREVSADTTPLPEYPRPQMVRASLKGSIKALRDVGDPSNWQSLNGLWEWERAAAITDNPVARPPFGKTLNSSILVPFPFESCLSGRALANSLPVVAASMWYRLPFTMNAMPSGRTLLHFGAVDWQSVFFLNGKSLGNHTGGYDGFSFDITASLKATQNELLVYVYDPSNLGNQPNGKQNIGSPFFPGGGQYTPSSGIWQSVWLEAVPQVYISGLSLNQNSNTTLTIAASVEGALHAEDNVTVVVNVVAIDSSTKVIATGTAAPGAAVALRIPSPRLWGPDDPNLYDVQVQLIHSAAAVDEVLGYFGLRSFGLGKKSGVTRPLLNDKFTFLAGWLDQSWWPDGQYTAPTDEALASDLQAVPMFGLNMVRLHMKVNSERWYYHADTLGVVVFQDMVQKICTTKCTKLMLNDYIADLKAMIRGRKNHPCIVQFTLLNEQDMWQLFDTKPFDLPGLLAFARALAPEHLIDMESGADGEYGQSIARTRLGDVVDYHTYPAPSVKPNATATQYAMLGEFGGVGAFVPGKEWRPPTPKQKSCFAYNLPLHPLATPADEAQAYIAMTDTLLAWSDQVSAAVYTQISDVELECDGFLNYDRTSKFDELSTAAIKAANERLTRPGGR